eukprot:scaffold92450_cov21-Tisochrysis_lutea.AAC.1
MLWERAWAGAACGLGALYGAVPVRPLLARPCPAFLSFPLQSHSSPLPLLPLSPQGGESAQSRALRAEREEIRGG